MLVEFRRPRAEDFSSIELQPFDRPLQEDVRANAARIAEIALADPGSLTCLEDGRVVGIGGVLPNHEAWQFFAGDCRRSFPHMVRRIRAAIIEHVLTHGEVWVMIDPDRPNARRWAALLGFEHVKGDIWHITYSTLYPPSH